MVSWNTKCKEVLFFLPPSSLLLIPPPHPPPPSRPSEGKTAPYETIENAETKNEKKKQKTTQSIHDIFVNKLLEPELSFFVFSFYRQNLATS